MVALAPLKDLYIVVFLPPTLAEVVSGFVNDRRKNREDVLDNWSTALGATGTYLDSVRRSKVKVSVRARQPTTWVQAMKRALLDPQAPKGISASSKEAILYCLSQYPNIEDLIEGMASSKEFAHRIAKATGQRWATAITRALKLPSTDSGLFLALPNFTPPAIAQKLGTLQTSPADLADSLERFRKEQLRPLLALADRHREIPDADRASLLRIYESVEDRTKQLIDLLNSSTTSREGKTLDGRQFGTPQWAETLAISTFTENYGDKPVNLVSRLSKPENWAFDADAVASGPAILASPRLIAFLRKECEAQGTKGVAAWEEFVAVTHPETKMSPTAAAPQKANWPETLRMNTSARTNRAPRSWFNPA